MAAPVVGADRTRKALMGVPATESAEAPPWEGAYSPALTEDVYEELLRRAGAVLTSGRPVVLDASFRARRHREAAALLAREHGVDFYFVECRAPVRVSRERLRRRAGAPSVSDARADLLDEFLARWEPVDELDGSKHIVLDTSEPIDASMETLRSRLVTWPVEPTQGADGELAGSSA